jgi:hypothetical protein
MDKLQLLAFVVMLTWAAWELFLAAVNHGKPKKHSILASMTSTGVSIGLLYFGGFFAVIAWPHIVWFILTVVGALAMCGGYMKDDKYNFGASFFAHAVVWFIYLKGGFWYTGFIPFH